MNKELEIKMKIASILARPEVNLLDQSKKLTDIYEVLDEQLILYGVSQQREMLEGFVDWFNANDKTQAILSERIEEYLQNFIKDAQAKQLILSGVVPSACNFYMNGMDTSSKCNNCGKPEHLH